MGFNFFQMNLFNEELKVFQIIVSLVLPTDPSNLKCLVPKAYFFTLDIIAEHTEHIRHRY